MYKNTLDQENIICISCRQLIEINISFCKNCLSPIIQNSIDNISEFEFDDNIWVKATEVKPKFLVLFVMWFLHFPVLILSIYLVVQTINEMSGTKGFLFFWAGTLLAFTCIVMLFRVTKNYLFKGKTE